jgi:hypothetical protein
MKVKRCARLHGDQRVDCATTDERKDQMRRFLVTLAARLTSASIIGMTSPAMRAIAVPASGFA